MVTDQQVRKLMGLLSQGKNCSLSAAKSGMDVKTARKYRLKGKLPSDLKTPHEWRTRVEVFQEVWEEILEKLELNPGLAAKTLFVDLQRRYPGRFSDGQLRGFQRKVKRWRALSGPSKEIYFPQEHHPGELCQSDFTHMDKLGVTICGEPFPHMIYHFVLTYSNWESGSICFSESFESLSDGLQNALWHLGGVPIKHRTDRLTAAVNKADNPQEFTERYSGLLRHYGLIGCKTQAYSPNENGDIEQRHYRFKQALDQSLMLRGSRDFANRGAYELYIRELFKQLNMGRSASFSQELSVLRQLPVQRLDSYKRIRASVGYSSTIRASHNTYSVHSRMRGERVDVRLYSEHLEVWYGQQRVEKIPRLRGENKHRIDYRHVIDILVRKPGAFANYRYRSDMFPTHRFRMAYDYLKQHVPARADKEYLSILELAAKENESLVDDALQLLINSSKPISCENVEAIVHSGQKLESPFKVNISAVDLSLYDMLLRVAGGLL